MPPHPTTAAFATRNYLWTLNEDGKIEQMRHYVDTAEHIAAAAGADTTLTDSRH